MTIQISIPTPLRTYTDNQKRVQVEEAKKVSEALTILVTKYPKLRSHLFEGDKLRNFVNIYLNNEDVRYLENKQETELSEGDNLAIIPAIAGGSRQ